MTSVNGEAFMGMKAGIGGSWGRCWALAALCAAGCATLPQVAFRSQPVPLDPEDRLRSFADAQEAVELLRDPAFTDPGPFGEVVVTASSVSLGGFKTPREGGLAGVPNRGGPVIALSPETSFFSESRGHISIWLADVDGISVEHRLAYAQDPFSESAELKPDGEAYVCQLRFNDGRYAAFYCARQDYAKRLASGFAYLSGKPVSGNNYFPPSGCLLDYDRLVVQVELIGGPFDQAGIPLGAQIVEVDNHWASEEELRTVVAKLGSGEHVVRYRATAGGRDSAIRRADVSVPLAPSY